MFIQYNSKKFLFIHIGGCAGTSIEYYLYCYLQNNNLEYDYNIEKNEYSINHLRYIKTINENNFTLFLNKCNFNSHSHNKIDFYKKYINIDNTIIFTVIKNPYMRCLSKFFTSPHCKNINSINDAQYKFENFIKEIYELKTNFSIEQKMHTECQSNYIIYNGKYIENIIKFENLNDNFLNFIKKYNLPEKKLLKCNSTFSPYKNINIYTNISKDIVYKNNKIIIDKFYEKI